MKTAKNVYLGFDLGAGTGRAVLGFLENGRLRIEEIHRFMNSPVQLGGTLYWDILSLWAGILDSLRLCARRGLSKLRGIGVDTWGVDFGLIGEDGRLLGLPVHYRDARTEGIEKVIARAMGEKEIYRLTGMAIGRVVTLSQLVAMNRSREKYLLETADTFLMMSDLLRYFLCGDRACELTALGSSQLIDVRGRWCRRAFQRFRLPLRIMPRIVKPGTVVGKLRPAICRETGLSGAPIVATAGHDTASAAAAVPFVGPDTAFVSCGTWSVLGIITDRPITSEAALRAGFVNEFGLDSMLFVKNMPGLYLVETLRRQWMKKGGEQSHSDMMKDASSARPFEAFIDTSSPMFFASDDLEGSIASYLRQTGQKTLRGRGRIIRAVLEGLVFAYRRALIDLVALTGRRLKRFCIVGGGVHNSLLCQMVADATGLEVVAGPAEATVSGNLAMQAMAAGQLRHASEIRTLIRNSFPLRTYKPRRTTDWDERIARHTHILERSRQLQ